MSYIGVAAASRLPVVRLLSVEISAAHDGQTRRSGDPYITHPLAVASILADMHMDAQSLSAALLHDVIEDIGISKEALAQQFGLDVAELVDGVSKLTQFEFEDRAHAQAENFQKMALAMARYIRVSLVKLSDRLHNMRTLEVMSIEQRKRIATETLEIYAPIALRLGMNSLRVELEDLSFEALYPLRARRIKAAVKKARGNRKEIVKQIRGNLKACLSEENFGAEVFGREKHLYSIYSKMRYRRYSFSKIMDVFAFRIVVDSVDTCYRVLGAVHSLYKPVSGQFKDYIAIPKANGYQSLHTVLFGTDGVPIEVQIRTRDMEEMANHGIAAHWLYKSGRDSKPQATHVRARQWVQGLLDMQKSAGNSLEFIESVKLDLFPDEVYVFSPKGKIMELPSGATPVDFAYAVHTDIGNTCVACRLDRQLSPLSTELASGQTVEIVTAPGAHPNPNWLDFVTTAKARSTIRHFLKNQRHNESRRLGERLLSKALVGLGSSLEQLENETLEQMIAEAGRDSFDEILEEIGLGNRVALLTARRLVARSEDNQDNNELDALAIQGTEGLMLNYARCCFPIPGDPITGHVSAGRGIVVHATNCHNITDIASDPERCTPLKWADNVEGEFQVELAVELINQRGIVATLASRISSMDTNIEKISIEEKEAQLSLVHLILAVEGRIHLARIIRRIRTVKAVQKVTRIRH